MSRFVREPGGAKGMQRNPTHGILCVFVLKPLTYQPRLVTGLARDALSVRVFP